MTDRGGLLGAVRGQGRAMALLATFLRRQTPPPAMIFTGPRGVGRRTAARAFAAALNCDRGNGCGSCPSCRLDQAGEGWREVDVRAFFEDPAANRSALLRREIATHAQAHALPWRTILFDHADRMNETMQAALLKTIEEPAPGVVYILLAPSTDHLSATIRSRSIPVRFGPLDDESLLLLLEKSQGRRLSSQERELAVSAGGSIERAAALVKEFGSVEEILGTLLGRAAEGGKRKRTDVLDRFSDIVPVLEKRRPEWRPALLELEKALAANAKIELALEVFRRACGAANSSP